MSAGTVTAQGSDRSIPQGRLQKAAWVVGSVVSLEVVMIGLAFVWVAIYAHLIHVGENEAFYEAYAQVASPVVSLVAGMPVFFGFAYGLHRLLGARATGIVVGTLVVYLALDVMVIATVAEDQLYNWSMWTVCTVTKIAATVYGVRLGQRSLARSG